MALAETTLSAAVAQTETSIKVASATSLAADRVLQIDGELMQVTKGYVLASTDVPVLRGRFGSKQTTHVVSARVVHGNASDFSSPAAGEVVTYPPGYRGRKIVSITATTATLTLPASGEDLIVVLNGTDAITLTVPVPTRDLDTCRISFIPNGAAAHVLTFTGGLGGASSGYTTVTFNGTGTLGFEVIACNELWCGVVAVPAAGTVTNITATVA